MTTEERLQNAIHIRFSLPTRGDRLKATIKKADIIAAYCEATELAGFSLEEAARFFGQPRGIEATALDLEPKPAAEVQRGFLKRFEALAGEMGRGVRRQRLVPAARGA